MPNLFSTIRTLQRSPRRLERIPLRAVTPASDPARGRISPESVEALADSIRRYGLLSPLIVRRTDEGEYELIAGARRLRALLAIGASAADAIVLNAADRDAALISLVENLQRVDLNCFEEAEGYQTVIRRFGLTQEELARRIGKSASCVANRLRLLRLGPAVRREVIAANLSERHARALLKLESELMQLKAVQLIVDRGLSVARAERLIDEMIAEKPEPPRPAVRLLLRSRKLFVNTVMETVRQLQNAGLHCESRVEEGPERVQIILSLAQADDTRASGDGARLTDAVQT